MNPDNSRKPASTTPPAPPTVAAWELTDPLRFALVEWHRKGWRVCVTTHERVHRAWHTVQEAGTDLVCTCGEDKFGMLECRHASAVRAFWHLRRPRIAKVEPGMQPLPFPNVAVTVAKPPRRKIAYVFTPSRVRPGLGRPLGARRQTAAAAKPTTVRRG